MVALYDWIKVATATTGTGTITLGAAVRDATNGDCITLAEAGVADGTSVRYFIQDGHNRAKGIGTTGSSGTTLTRDASEKRWNGSAYTTAALSLSGSAVVYIDASADDLVLGPASATDNAVARFDGTTGRLVQNSKLIVDDAGNVTQGGYFTSGGTVTGVDGNFSAYRAADDSIGLQFAVYTAGAALYFSVEDFSIGQTIWLDSGHPKWSFYGADLIFDIVEGSELARLTTAGRFLLGTTDTSGTSLVKAAGAIESTTGGFVFPDATVQTSAVRGGTADCNFGSGATALSVDVTDAQALTTHKVTASMSAVQPTGVDFDELEMDPILVAATVPTDGTVRLKLVSINGGTITGARRVNYALAA